VGGERGGVGWGWSEAWVALNAMALTRRCHQVLNHVGHARRLVVHLRGGGEARELSADSRRAALRPDSHFGNLSTGRHPFTHHILEALRADERHGLRLLPHLTCLSRAASLLETLSLRTRCGGCDGCDGDGGGATGDCVGRRETNPKVRMAKPNNCEGDDFCVRRGAALDESDSCPSDCPRRLRLLRPAAQDAYGIVSAGLRCAGAILGFLAKVFCSRPSPLFSPYLHQK